MEKKPDVRIDRSRILGLDALRQIAAFVVLVQHFMGMFEVQAPSWLVSWVFDAKGAVTLFFVLSGYVLTLSIGRESVSLRGYVNFGIRRVLRLYPLHIAATLLAFVVITWVIATGGLTKELGIPASSLDDPTPNWKQWLLQLTLVAPGMQSDFANPPVWTLMTEAKVAIVFPLMAWILLRASTGVSCVLVAALVLGSDWLENHLVGTVALLGQFALGILIAKIPAGVFGNLGKLMWVPWVVISLVLYSLVSLRGELPSIWIAYYLCSFGAAGIIVAVVHWETAGQFFYRLQKLFRVDISYGLYILHFPVILFFRKLTGESAGPLATVGLFVAVALTTIVLSVILMRFLEKPAIRLGKRLTRKYPEDLGPPSRAP